MRTLEVSAAVDVIVSITDMPSNFVPVFHCQFMSERERQCDQDNKLTTNLLIQPLKETLLIIYSNCLQRWRWQELSKAFVDAVF